MKCLRCGCCCTELDIFIVNPDSIKIDGTVNLHEESMVLKPKGVRCPHLVYQDKTAVCAIHHLPCYSGTPCELFEQFGTVDSICMTGRYFKAVLKKKS